MFRLPVRSGIIKSVGYGYGYEDRVLTIEFTNGSIYKYNDVPENVYDALMTADSVGSYFHHNIKGKYTAKKVEQSGRK